MRAVDRGAGPTSGARARPPPWAASAACPRAHRAPAEAEHIGVVADEPAPLPGDGVHGAGALRLLGEPVHHRHDPLLVGYRDVRAERVRSPRSAAMVSASSIERPVHELVAGIDAEGIERRLLEDARQGMGNRMADEGDAFGHEGSPARAADGGPPYDCGWTLALQHCSDAPQQRAESIR